MPSLWQRAIFLLCEANERRDIKKIGGILVIIDEFSGHNARVVFIQGINGPDGNYINKWI